MGHGGGTIKHYQIYALLFAMCMVVAVIPMAGAVTDQNSENVISNANQGLQLGVTSAEAQQMQSTIQDKKPFGALTGKVLAQTNLAVNTDPNVLKLGDSGDKVKELQTWLTNYGYYSGAIDGNFGADTEKAVKQFQLEASIQVDGKVGNQTQTTMAKWDQYLAKIQATAGNSNTASSSNTATSSKSISTAKKTYAKSYARAVRSSRGGKGIGDCWTNSAALYSQLTGSGQKARIIQYATSLSARHRSVQVYSNGAWVNYNYKANGYAQTYYATSNSVKGKVV
jgi:N-acetylmuramoyl-L-alanine amidase